MISSRGKNKTHNSILLSIKPKWFELIKSGKKSVEIRRKFCEVNYHDELFFYVSSPVKKILLKATGCMSGTYAYYDRPDLICGEETCLTYDEAKEYLFGRKEYCQIFLPRIEYIGEVNLELSDFGLKRPPQNYCYLRKK